MDPNSYSPTINLANYVAIPANNPMQDLQGPCEVRLYGTSTDLVTDPAVAPMASPHKFYVV